VSCASCVMLSCVSCRALNCAIKCEM
jgi:hypothetical protein